MNKEKHSELLEIKNLNFSYDSSKNILKDISLSVNDGDFFIFTGVNGSGKTTLVKIIAGLIKNYSGKVLFNCCDSEHEHRFHIGYVPQRFSIDKQFPATVRELLSLKTKDFLYLEKLEIKDLLDKKFSDLSGGQQQRVLIGLALQNKPRILILDEPESNIDHSSQKKLYRILKEINQSENLTIIMVTHDIGIIPKIATRVLLLNKEVLCIAQPKDSLKLIKQKLKEDSLLHIH